MLLARLHVLQRHLAFGHLALAGQSYKGDVLGVGIVHLLLHLRLVGEKLGGNARLAQLGHQWHAVGRLGVAEVDEEDLRALTALLRIEVEGVEHVVDAVCAKGEAHTRKTGHTEDAREVVVASATRDAADLHVESLHLEDGSRVVVEAAGQRQVELHGIVETHALERVEDETDLLDALQSRLALAEHLGDGGQLLVVSALQVDDRLQAGDGLL